MLHLISAGAHLQSHEGLTNSVFIAEASQQNSSECGKAYQLLYTCLKSFVCV